MKAQKKTICLNRKGVDEASECIQNWLQEAGILLQADRLDLVDRETLRQM